jgi:methionine-rich copper-binding protein CopC
MATSVSNCAPVTRFTLHSAAPGLPRYVTFGVASQPVRVKNQLWAALIGLASGPLLAHAHLQQSEPADGSRLERAPAQLVLSFSEPARLVLLTIARDGGAPQKLSSLPDAAQKRIVVSLPTLTAGDYVMAWRVIGTDGHVVPGGLHFTLTQ